MTGVVTHPARHERLNVGLVVPRSGPAGIFGPSCEACATLAAEDVNAAGGLLGNELRLRVIDGGQTPIAVATEVDRLISAGSIEAVAGWHISAVRQALDPVVSGRVPYVYSPLYEGGERTPGVFLTGETPDRQLIPAMRWVARELGVQNWFVLGDDYVWPQASARTVRQFARTSAEIRIVGEMFVPLGTEDFGGAVDRILRSNADGVLMFLVGSDAVRFNRVFAQAQLDQGCVRLSPLMEENMLLGSGADNTRNLYSASGFFETLITTAGLDFSRRYTERFGVDAPVLNSLGESCYEGLTLLAQLVGRVGSVQPGDLCRAADSLVYESPRGVVAMAENHLLQSVYLARAESLEFDVLVQLADLPA